MQIINGIVVQYCACALIQGIELVICCKGVKGVAGGSGFRVSFRRCGMGLASE